MINTKNHSSLFRSCLLVITVALYGITCNAQSNNSIDLLRKYAGNIHQFNSIFPQEKVFLQFDNTSYYTGETIWFKAFVTNASDLSRAQSHVLYVDLISPKGELLKQQKLKIVAGQADGSLPLLDGSTAQARDKRGVLEYPSGFYEVRAYTSYMLNFDEGIVFSRVFAVFEKPKKDGDYYDSNPTIKIRNTNDVDLRPKTEKTHDINASFYPEGGHLIVGKPCRIAFKVTDESGFGTDAQGVIEDLGLSFSTVHNGMGEFTFTPSKRNQVSISSGGKTQTFNLPQAQESGFILKAEQAGDSILVNVDCTDDLKGKTLGMTLTCRGELMDFATIECGSSNTGINFQLANVPEGVCRIHLFDSNGTLYASRSFYHHSKVDRTPLLEVSTDKSSYNPFERIQLNFSLKDGHGNPFRDRFCLAVRDTRSPGNAFADDLRTSMLLSSDLKGMIEAPSWYFDSNDPEHDKALDLLCMIQGWERYEWATMTGQKEFTEKHRIEEELTLNGWIMNSSGRKPLENIRVRAAVVPKDKRMTETYAYKTDSTGYFGFDLGMDFYEKAALTISAHGAKKSLVGPNARIVFERSMTPAIRAFQPQELVVSSNQSNARKYGKTQTVQEDEGLPVVISKENGFVLPEVDIEEDRMYIDYFTFKAYDVVYDVERDLDKGDYSTDLYGYLISKGFELMDTAIFDTVSISTDPLLNNNILINGFKPFFYIHNTSRYIDKGISDYPFQIDAQDIKSIIVYDRPMFFSDIIRVCPLFDDFLSSKNYQTLNPNDEYTKMILEDQPVKKGVNEEPKFIDRRMMLVDILIKETKEQSLYSELFKLDRRYTTVDGYSTPYAFYSPEYPDGPVTGDVDYRRTLYWNPNIITDKDGKAQVEFYNSSITSHFNISAAGITASGVPYVLESEF